MFFTFWSEMIRAAYDACRNIYHRSRVAFYSVFIDSSTFMSWRPHTIDGVPNIPGI